MCGIVAAVARREVSEILLEGLRRLEYRGYDSAGIAVVSPTQTLDCHKRPGKVAELEAVQAAEPITGQTGIAHTRWATHGEPSEANAHPHLAGDRIALVHNGIIENHAELRRALESQGVVFQSDTDTEVIVHLLHQQLLQGEALVSAVRSTLSSLQGAYAIAVIDRELPETVIVARHGSPLVLGVGIGETFAGSDTLALRSVTDTFIYLEDGDVACLTPGAYDISDQNGAPVQREATRLSAADDAVELGQYDHYMRKEIFEQPERLTDTLNFDEIADDLLGESASSVLSQVQAIQMLACGTSFHAGLVAKYWIESLVGIPCFVEVASEYRYRDAVLLPGTLAVSISQSGETADTLAALKHIQSRGVLAALAVCNVDHSAIVRASDLVYLTRAGAEIGVASTKAFTTQLAALLVLTGCLARHQRPDADLAPLHASLKELPDIVAAVLARDADIRQLARHFIPRHHALFLGRGIYYPIAMEGALKLKEISYIHAEAYPAGELKHGPLALVDNEMPVVAVAPNDQLLDKLRSNLEEVRARGGELFVFADEAAGYVADDGVHVLNMPSCSEFAGPIAYSVALQLLSYHVAVARGTDIDKPRNLAKSVTVE